MHDIYRTDKLSTEMGENDVIFIATINKWNPISSGAFSLRGTTRFGTARFGLRFHCSLVLL